MKKMLIAIFIILLFFIVSCGDDSKKEIGTTGDSIQEDPCKNVTCSDLGSCKVVNNEATCECDQGFQAYNLTCIEDCAEGEHLEDDGICYANIKTISCIDTAPQYATSEITDVEIEWNGIKKEWNETPECEWSCNDDFKEENNICICEDSVTKSNGNYSFDSPYSIKPGDVIEARTSKLDGDLCNYSEDWYKTTLKWGYNVHTNIRFKETENLKIEIYDAGGSRISDSFSDNYDEENYINRMSTYGGLKGYSDKTIYILVKGVLCKYSWSVCE